MLARRNVDSVAHRTTPCASGREARRSLDRCPVSFIDLDHGRGNTEQIQAVGHHVQLNYWHFRRQSLPTTMSLEAQSSALAGRFQRFGTALFDTADCAEWH